MRDGFTKDDAWIMVEDEFLQTARLYTQHLHHAEYQRLKSQAKEQRASAIQSIVRPVTNSERMTSSSKKALEAKALFHTQEATLDGIQRGDALPTDDTSLNNDGDDDDDESFGTNAHLVGLLRRPVRGTRKLARLAAASSNTRAAAGFARPKPSLPKQSLDSTGLPRNLHKIANHEKKTIDGSLDSNNSNRTKRSCPATHSTNDSTEFAQYNRSDLSEEYLFQRGEGRRKSIEQKEPCESSVGPNVSHLGFSEEQVNADLAPTTLCSIGSINHQPEDSSDFSQRMEERRRIRKRRREERLPSESVKLENVPTFLV